MEAPQRDGFPSSASTTQYNALGRAWTQEPAELKSVGRCCLKDQLGEVWKYINLYIYNKNLELDDIKLVLGFCWRRYHDQRGL